MSVRSISHSNSNYGNSRSTRVEDYYSDEEVDNNHNTPVSSYSSNSPRHSPNHFHAYNNKRNNVINRNSGLRNSVRYFHPEDGIHGQPRYGYSEDDEDEEDLRRAIHDFGLEDHMYNNRLPLPPPRRRSSFEYEMENRMMYSPHHSPGYFLPPPPPRFEDDLHYHHLMGDNMYGPPPPPMHHPHPPPHWLPPPPHPSQEFGPPQNDMIMYSPQQQPMDLRRSASSRSYNRRNRPNQRTFRRNPEARFLSRDDNEEPLPGAEYDVNNHRFRQPHPSQLRPPLSRQNSVGSNSSRKSNNKNNGQFRKKRANSFSAPGTAYPPPPPHFFMQPPPPHDFYGPRIRSEPNSPRLSLEDSSSSGDEISMDEYYGRHGARRNSMPAAGGRGNLRPLGRSLSFQGIPPPPMIPPPQPQQQGGMPPHIIMHPPPMPHPGVMDNTLRRNASMFNLPTNPAGGNPGGNDFFVDPNIPQQPQQQPPPAQEHTNGSTTPASANELPPQMPMWMGMPHPPPPSMGAFPTSPGTNIGNPFNQQQHQQQQQAAAAAAAQMMMAGGPPMGMFNNPMMPPQQPMWNFMNPQDLFLGNDMPLPFMNSSDPNVIMNAMGAPPPQQAPKPQGSPGGGESGGGPSGPSENDGMRGNRPEEGNGGPGGMIPPPNEMMMPPPPPPQEPMLRRGLSMLGGLFGGGGGSGRKNGPPYFGGPPPPPHFGGEEFGPRGGGGFGNFRPPIQGGGYQSKKEAKLAQQYQKLGLIWCWRVANSEDNRFESFNIANQKLIKRKADKPESMNGGGIMLGREKKLPGEIMIDVHRGYGCAMTMSNGNQQFTSIEIKQEPFEGSSIMFNSGGGGGGNWM